MKRNLMLGIMVLLLALAVVPLSCGQTGLTGGGSGATSAPNATEREPEGDGGIGAIMPVPDAEYSLKWGYYGYVFINVSEDTPEVIYADRGEDVNITVLVHLISFLPNFTQANIKIAPHDPTNAICLEPYNGRDGYFCVNDLISYIPNGTVEIKANETLPITLVIHVPEDFPPGLQTISVTPDLGILMGERIWGGGAAPIEVKTRD